ncbi:MAG: nickel pincer cofactor biosynthesis protein LarB [Ignavibacteriales bacterium]|nr:nickel pincer cofactor biosynthesis protein LarB [Ignavibacteriales bacterium]
MSDPNHERMEILEQFARLDIQRRDRTGIPEAIFAEGKTPEQVARMLDALAEKSGYALATRVSEVCAQYALDHLSSKVVVQHNRTGRTLHVRRHEYEPKSTGGKVAVLAAGTSDLPVAEEAKVTAEVMGCEVFAFYDVGVAGIHRLLGPVETIVQKEIAAVVVAAGMEGALPSVVRGLVPVPVIGVPTSIGYGYGGKGEAALMSMLQSCSPGLTVVNIDNGFGAGATAALIANYVAASKVK